MVFLCLTNTICMCRSYGLQWCLVCFNNLGRTFVASFYLLSLFFPTSTSFLSYGSPFTSFNEQSIRHPSVHVRLPTVMVVRPDRSLLTSSYAPPCSIRFFDKHKCNPWIAFERSSLSRTRIQRPPKTYGNPLEAMYRHLLETISHTSLQKAGVMSLLTTFPLIPQR